MASARTVAAAAAARRWPLQDVVSVVAVAVPTTAVSVAAVGTGDYTAAGVAAITGCTFVLTTFACIDVRRQVLPNVIVIPALAILLAVVWIRADQSVGGTLAARSCSRTSSSQHAPPLHGNEVPAVQ